MLKEPWVDICMSECTSEILSTANLYPMRGHLDKLLKDHNIHECDTNTVATIVNRLLHTASMFENSFENSYAVSNVLFDKVTTIPDVIQLAPHQCFQFNLERCAILIAILRKHCSQPLGGHSFILKKTPAQVIKVKSQIHCFEHTRDDIPTLPSPPDFFEGDVLACDNFQGLIECLDELAILVKAPDNQGIELAIRIAIFKNNIARGNPVDWNEVVAPAINSSFRETCQTICRDQGKSMPPKILRSIVETINKESLLATHALRTGDGGNSPQKMRNHDKAWRRDIDREFHLHYWECAGSMVELASVVVHDDFTIPE